MVYLSEIWGLTIEPKNLSSLQLYVPIEDTIGVKAELPSSEDEKPGGYHGLKLVPSPPPVK